MSNYLWGGLLVLLGIIFGINSLGLASINIFFDGWWTLFIIIPCLINLVNDKDKVGNAIGLLIGVLLFLSCRDIIGIGVIWKLLLPSIFIIIGLSIMFKETIDSKIRDNINNINKNNPNSDEYCATFGEQKVDFSNEIFNGCNLQAIFGTIKCNIKTSKIKDDVVINVLSLFGSNTIIVPDNINIKIKGTPVFGSIKNNNVSTKDSDITIYINVSCLFGEVDIR